MLFNMGPQELVVIGVLAVLLFGKRLPEVARSLGGSYKQFRKGLSEMQAQLQVDDLPSAPSYYSDDYDDYDQPTAPKFEPPASEPSASEPGSSEPAANEPASSEPASSEPAPSEPAAETEEV